MSEAPSTTTPKDPPAGRKFPCPKCAARLDFDPSSRHLACPYCGYQQEIASSGERVQEQDWETYWNTQAGRSVQLEGRSSQVTCTGCGAVVLLQDNIETDKCPYCATHLENKPESAQGMIEPQGVLAFAVSHRDAINAFNDWIASRWFAPTGLKQFSNLGKLAGAYVPFWTYDSMTYTSYSGERGDDYTVTESYTATETDDQGQSRQVTKTRQVTRTRWSSVSGNVRHFFDDVLIQASQSLPRDLVAYLTPWDLEKLEGFRPDFLSGFQTERYTIGLREGFDQAREVMDGEIRDMCRRDIGGDHQRLHAVQTQHVGVTFKHILLPIWIAAYRYHDTPYRILINGRTGQVTGNRPYSWWKIGLLVAVILLAVLAVVLALSAAGALKSERRNGGAMVAQVQVFSPGGATWCSQGRQPLDLVDHHVMPAPEGRHETRGAHAAPPGLPIPSDSIPRGLRPWLHHVAPPGLNTAPASSGLNTAPALSGLNGIREGTLLHLPA